MDLLFGWPTFEFEWKDFCQNASRSNQAYFKTPTNACAHKHIDIKHRILVILLEN